MDDFVENGDSGFEHEAPEEITVDAKADEPPVEEAEDIAAIESSHASAENNSAAENEAAIEASIAESSVAEVSVAEASVAENSVAEASVAADSVVASVAESVADEAVVKPQTENEDAISQNEPVLSSETNEQAEIEDVTVDAAEKIDAKDEIEADDSFNPDADGALTSSKNDLANEIALTEQALENELEEQVEDDQEIVAPIASEAASPEAVSLNGQEAPKTDVDSAIVKSEAVNNQQDGASDTESEWVDDEVDSKPEPS